MYYHTQGFRKGKAIRKRFEARIFNTNPSKSRSLASRGASMIDYYSP